MNQETTKKKKGKAWLVVLLVLLLLVLLVVGGVYWVINSKLNLIQYDDGSKKIDTETVYEVNNDELEIGDLPDAPETEVDPDADKLEILHDDDVLNILLLGTDERTKDFSDNARADSMMVLSLNTKLHTIKLVSIERGIGVPVPGRNDDWLTHTFRYGGAKLTMDTIKELFRLDLDRYARVNFRVFEEGINAIGGVDINLTQAEYDYLGEVQRSTGDTSTPLQVGYNHVNGNIARQYCQLREIDSDWKRIERQRKVIQAAVKQASTLSLDQLNNLVDTILPMIRTNLTKGEIASLMLEVPGFLANGLEIENMTIPTRDTCWNTVGVDGRKMIGVDFDANARILRKLFYGVEE